MGAYASRKPWPRKRRGPRPDAAGHARSGLRASKSLTMRGAARLPETTAAPLRFEKYEGLGNDFILVDAPDDREMPPERATRLCDRRFGVGADGVLLVLPPRATGCHARMQV